MDRAKAGWTKLRCECGSQQFTGVFALIWREGGGVTTEPSGYECVQCRAFMDSATLVKHALLDAKKRELAELQAQMRDEEETPSASHIKG